MIRREEKIFVNVIDNKTFEVTNRDGEVALSQNDNYFIYFKNANFKNGVIEGRYLGETPNVLIDDHCFDITYDNGVFMAGGRPIKTARMVAVNNSNGAIVVISND